MHDDLTCMHCLIEGGLKGSKNIRPFTGQSWSTYLIITPALRRTRSRSSQCNYFLFISNQRRDNSSCLATSDQNLFKRLRQSPGFARMSTVDQMLLGVKIPLDEIEVEEISSDEDAFAANFLIPQFHKRMAISKLEFIARGMYHVLFGVHSSLIPLFKKVVCGVSTS